MLCSLNDNNISKINAKLLHKTFMGEKCELNNIKKDSQNLYFKNILRFWKEKCSNKTNKEDYPSLSERGRVSLI